MKENNKEYKKGENPFQIPTAHSKGGWAAMFPS